jgi:cation diffusion facilitator family transporter
MPTDRLERGLRATFLGLGVNVAFTAVKFAAGLLGHSHALIADAVESGADILSSIIVWRALVVAAVPADGEHPYGHGKAEPLAAASIAVLLLVAAAGIMLNSARSLVLVEPRQVPRAFTLYVLLAVVSVKEALFRFVSREARSVQSGAVHADAWHHRSDALTSLAAAIGISLGLLGGPRFALADDAAAMVAGTIIAWNGWRLLRPALDELMDAAPEPALVARIKSAAGQVPGVNRVEKCIVRKAGFEHFVDMHVEVDPRMSVLDAHQIAHHVKDRVRQAVPAVHDVLVHIEPSSFS